MNVDKHTVINGAILAGSIIGLAAMHQWTKKVTLQKQTVRRTDLDNKRMANVKLA